MAVIQIEDPSRRGRKGGFALFALAFRPFFLLGGWAGVVLVGVWAASFAAGWPLTTAYGYVGWHSHEMVFGYSSAVVAGFLLTAARNWTQVQTVRGWSLGGLALVWLAGRLLPWTPAPHAVTAAVDLAFLPLLAAALAWPLMKARHYKSLLFVGVLLLLGVANLVVHRGTLWGIDGRAALYFAVDLIILLIVIMGGRVIPFFTERALNIRVRSHALLERLAIASVALLAVAHLAGADHWTGVLAALAAAANGLRLAGWYSNAIWRVPILWILHTGYLWMAVGFALYGGAQLGGWGSPLLALHGLTAGAIGAVSLGMMARVSLGHTGRTLDLPSGMATAFVLLNAGIFVRVLVPLALPEAYGTWIGLSGLLWGAAFLIFAVRYTPILIRARIDGVTG